ncbi:MAG: hypothetical protein K2N71_09570 [Oscillospiraceae bacterium]|nr:hypothetical protein [Oscillospiraceae bacterium]
MLSDEMKIFQITAGIAGFTTAGKYVIINFLKPKIIFLKNGKEAEFHPDLKNAIIRKQKDYGVNGINQNK